MKHVEIYCDLCRLDDVTSTGESVRLAMNQTVVELDLCTKHADSIADFLQYACDIGGRAVKQRADRGRNKFVTIPNGHLPCGTCDRKFATPQGLGSHRWLAHRIPGPNSKPPANVS